MKSESPTSPRPELSDLDPVTRMNLSLTILRQVRALHAEALREAGEDAEIRPLSLAEISEITGISQGTLRDLNDRSLRKLRRRADERGLDA